jgi:hypothetical protein
MRALFLLLVGCTTVHHLKPDTPLAPINEALRDREAKVAYTDGRSTTTRNAELERELLYVEENGTRTQVPLEAVQSVRWVSAGHPNLRGALQGTGIGLVSGAGLGALIGFAMGSDTCDPRQICFLRFTAGAKAAAGAVVFSIVGALAGLITGGVIGHHDQVEITPRQSPPDPADDQVEIAPAPITP